MNLRLFPVVFGLVAAALLPSSALAAKSAKGNLQAFKGSYKGTFVVSPIQGASGAATITFVPAKSGKAAVLTITGPWVTSFVTYTFGATFDFGKNGKMMVNDGLLGYAPMILIPTVGKYQFQGTKKILLTESVSTGGGNAVQATGTLSISKAGRKKQQISADFLVVSSGGSSPPTSVNMQFTGIGKAPKL